MFSIIMCMINRIIIIISIIIIIIIRQVVLDKCQRPSAGVR